MHLMANEYGNVGIYRAILLPGLSDTDIRAFIPGINNVNPFKKDNTIDLEKYEQNKEIYPKVQFCCYNLESKEVINIKGPAWVMFENGNSRRPVCISYSVIGGSASSDVNGEFVSVNVRSNSELIVEQEVSAYFTAYYSIPNATGSAENRREGGPLAAYNDEVLDYTQNTCAAPQSVDFNSYVVPIDTNTGIDNVIYRVNDRGGAIIIDNQGRYHFDILMKDRETANNFGTKTGKAKLGKTLKLKVTGGNSNKGLQIVEEARKYKGTPYEWGGDDPGGFDCSGFTQYVYKQCGISIPRTSSEQYKDSSASERITDINQLQPGDLVFFTGSDGSKTNPGHVGIYVGNGKMIHAPSSGTTITDDTSITSGYYNRNFVGGSRYTT